MPEPGAARPLRHFFEEPRDLFSYKGVRPVSKPYELTGCVLVGDDTGLIKVVSLKEKKVIRIWNAESSVLKLCWANSKQTDGSQFLALLKNGNIQVYNSISGNYFTAVKREIGVNSMFVIDNKQSEHKDRLLFSMNNRGIVRLWSIDKNSKENRSNWKTFCKNTTTGTEYDQLRNKYPLDMKINNLPRIIANETKDSKNKNKNKTKSKTKTQIIIPHKRKNRRNRHEPRGMCLTQWNINPHGKNGKTGENGQLCVMKGHPLNIQQPWIGVGGKDRPVEIWDFNKQERIFKGKHVCWFCFILAQIF